jgi:hypothetical protein
MKVEICEHIPGPPFITLLMGEIISYPKRNEKTGEMRKKWKNKKGE